MPFLGKLVIICILLTFAPIAWTDMEAPYESYGITSSYGNYYYKMIPDRPYDSESGSGICYKAIFGIPYKNLWKTNGWYARETYLSNDGKYLVRVAPWHSGIRPNDSDVGVAFYKEGKLIKSYSTNILVKDKRKALLTASHYKFRSHVPSKFEARKNRFTFVSIDCIEHIFDITTGEIISQKKHHPCSEKD